MRRLENAFVTLNGTVLVLGLMAMSVMLGWNVLGRYLTGNSLSWADEVARYSMIWLTFLGSGLALREGAHAAITNAQDALPGPLQRALRVLILLVLLGFFGFMVWVGVDYMNRMAVQRSAGFLLMIVHLVLMAPRYLRAGMEHPEESALG